MEPDEQSSSRPTVEVLDDVAQEITACWERLGRKLGLEQGTIDDILANNVQHPVPRMKAFEMLKTWYNKGGSTYGELANALKHVGMGRVAETFCGTHKGK